MTATLNTTSHIDNGWAVSGPRDPNYHLRRTVAASIVVLVVLLVMSVSALAVGALTGLGGRPAAASETPPAAGLRVASVYVAEPGDSLWSIAELHRGEIGRDHYIDALINLNGGTAIQAGQAVHLP